MLGKYPHFILTKDKLGVRHCISMADVVIKMSGEKRYDIGRGDSEHSKSVQAAAWVWAFLVIGDNPIDDVFVRLQLISLGLAGLGLFIDWLTKKKKETKRQEYDYTTYLPDGRIKESGRSKYERAV